MTAEQDGLDLAGIMADHRESPHNGERGTCDFCAWSDWPCLPYRLAALALDLQGKVARVEVTALLIAEQYGRLLAVHEQVVMDTPEDRALHDRVVAAFRNALPGLDAALADQPEQEQRA